MAFMEAIREASRFFMATDAVHETLRRVTKRLGEEQIEYALIDGMALFAHRYRRFTEDVDILTSREGLDAIHKRLVGRGYVPCSQAREKRFEIRRQERRSSS